MGYKWDIKGIQMGFFGFHTEKHVFMKNEKVKNVYGLKLNGVKQQWMFTKEHVCVMGRYMVAFGHTISWEIHTSIDDHPSVWETKPCQCFFLRDTPVNESNIL